MGYADLSFSTSAPTKPRGTGHAGVLPDMELGSRSHSVAWHAVKGTPRRSWSSIASGAHQTIRLAARALALAGYSMYFCFHQPENDGRRRYEPDVGCHSDGDDVLGWARGYSSWLPPRSISSASTGTRRDLLLDARPGDGDRSRRYSRLRTTLRWPRERGCSVGENGCVEHGTDLDAKARWFVEAG